MQEFGWAHPANLCQINSVFNGDVYGADMFLIDCLAFRKLINSHSTAVRTFLRIPRDSHEYIRENIGGQHPETSLLSNRIKLYNNPENHHKLAVFNFYNLAAGDMRTTTSASFRLNENLGVDLGLIYQNRNISDIDSLSFKKTHKFASIPKEEQYRIGIPNDLINQRPHCTSTFIT